MNDNDNETFETNNMTDLLFPVAETLSPRLAWQRKHSIRVWIRGEIAMTLPEYKVCAWLPTNDTISDGTSGETSAPIATGYPDHISLCGFGATETEAVTAMAQRNALPLWNEEAGP